MWRGARLDPLLFIGPMPAERLTARAALARPAGRMRTAVLLLVVIAGPRARDLAARRRGPPARQAPDPARRARCRSPAADLGPLELDGCLACSTAPIGDFGGYSALRRARRRHACSRPATAGGMMRFSPPGATRRRGPDRLLRAGRSRPTSGSSTSKSLTRDPASGRLWVGLRERQPRSSASMPGFRAEATVRPAGDARAGRATAGPKRWCGSPTGASSCSPRAPARFDERARRCCSRRIRWRGPSRRRSASLRPPASGRSTWPQLPDGRVLILLRKVVWGLPPGFAGKLVRGRSGDDPRGRGLARASCSPISRRRCRATISRGWRSSPTADGGAVLWLISDDNDSIAFQRTLLLKLRWPANEKARGNLRAPR